MILEDGRADGQIRERNLHFQKMYVIKLYLNFNIFRYRGWLGWCRINNTIRRQSWISDTGQRV